MKIELIAEIGWNHMGNIDLAKKMILSAKNSGADYAKFQTWSVKNLCSGDWDQDGRKEIYKKAELSQEMHEELFDFCQKQNIKFLTSLFNLEDLSKLRNINLKTIKVPSHEVYNIKLIETLTDMYETVLVSTGAAKWEEIKKITKIKNFKKIIFMHCVSAYPCNFEDLNFNKFEKLKILSDNQIGYSGHYVGIDDAKIAINLGANVIEKHFTVDNDLPGRDNKFALLPKKFKDLSDYRKKYICMRKNLNLDLQESEMDIFDKYRGRWG